MGANIVNITSFVDGENIQLSLAAKERDGSDLVNPESADIELSFAGYEGGEPILTFTLSDSEVDRTDSTFYFDIPEASYAALTPGRPYFYNIFTTVGPVVLHQIGGKFTVLKSVKV